MIRAVILSLLLLPGLAQAVICKTVGADGVVSYEELPAAECPQEVKLPEYSRYAPRPITPARPPAGNASGRTVRFERYTAIEIVQPQPDATVRSNQGRVPVSIALEPTLQQGHRIALYLDGATVPGSFDGTAIELDGVARGTHSLRAVVRDADGNRLIESNSVQFTLRQASLLDNAATPPEPPTPPDPGFPSPGEPPDYAPPGQPDYTPPGGGIPATPGRTNPSFAPSYSP